MLKARNAGLDTQLSFCDNLTVRKLQDAVEADDPENEFDAGFWTAALVRDPYPKFAKLMNKSLSYWVEVFNRWQELRRNRQAKESANEKELEQILNLPLSTIRNIGVFDLFFHGTGPPRVSMLVLMTGGVLLSRIISRNAKMKFLFGLFDSDDIGCLDKPQFILFLASFVRAVGPVFGVSPGQLPSTVELRKTAERLYRRIGANATMQEEGLPYESIWEWLCGDLSEEDPMALPYKLLLDRFCPDQIGGVSLDDIWEEFRLNHKEPVCIPDAIIKCPKHGKDTTKCTFPSRSFVIMAMLVFEKSCEQKNWNLTNTTLSEILQSAGQEAKTDIKRELLDGMRRLRQSKTVAKDGEPQLDQMRLVDYLSILCPCAHSRHLMMFEKWCHEYKELAQERDELNSFEEAHAALREIMALPVVPELELIQMERAFAKLDRDNNGIVSLRDIQECWGWSQDEASSAMAQFDLTGDGCVDRFEFMRIMCPHGYKLPDDYGNLRTVFAQLFTAGLEKEREELEDDLEAYTGSACLVEVHNPKVDAKRRSLEDSNFPAFLPEASSEQLQTWTAAFKVLDTNDDKKISARDLELHGLFTQEVAEAVIKIVDEDDDDQMTLDDFLEGMCRATGYRMPLNDG